MATYQKRGKAWRAMVRKNGISKSGTFDTKAEAVKWATTTEAEILAADLAADMAEDALKSDAEELSKKGHSVAHYMQRYSDEVSPGKRGGRWEKVRLQFFIREFPEFQAPAAKFTGPDMADWRDKRLLKVSAGSVARELNLISAVFTKSIKEWRLNLPANPCWLISKPKKPRARTQRVSNSDRDTLVKALGWDRVSTPTNTKQWTAAAFCFALETAMRKGEVLSLEWRDIHEDGRYAHLDMTKNGEERDVPLSTAALAILATLGRGKPRDRVFKVAVGHLDVLMREARDDTGLRHVRFHDARREATTNIASKLSNVLELSAVTGHKELRMLKIYYQPKPSDLAAKLG